MDYQQNNEEILHFSNWFRGLTLSKGYYLPKQVAHATRVSNDIIDLIWNAKQIPDNYTLEKIAKALDINVEDMLRAARSSA